MEDGREHAGRAILFVVEINQSSLCTTYFLHTQSRFPCINFTLLMHSFVLSLQFLLLNVGCAAKVWIVDTLLIVPRQSGRNLPLPC